MGTAARIRELRIGLGKSEAEMAQLLGINIHWYGDLEQHDDELISTLSLSQAMRVALLLGVALHDLIAEGNRPSQVTALAQLPECIISHATREGISVEQFEDRVGWKLRQFLDSPVQAAAQLPLIFFQDLAAGLGVDWLSIVPNETV